MSSKTMIGVARKVAATKAEAALSKAAGRPMSAVEIRDACGFPGALYAARVLGGLVRKGIARTLPASIACAMPRTWFLVPASETRS